MPKPGNVTVARGFVRNFGTGPCWIPARGDGRKDETSIIPVETGRWLYHKKAYRPSKTAPAHIGSSYQKGLHEHSIERREDEEFTEWPGVDQGQLEEQYRF